MGSRRIVRLAACLVVAAMFPFAVSSAAVGRDRTPPTAPTNLRVTGVTQTSVSLAWNPSTDNVGVSWYSVSREGSQGVLNAWPPDTSVTWSFLQPGETYTFRVTAFDANSNASRPSAPLTVTTLPPSPASPPSGLTVKTVTASKVLLEWSSGHDPADPDHVTHEVLVNGVPTANAWSTVAPGQFPRPPIQGAWVRQLDPLTSYQFTVRAFDASGDLLGSSNTVSATTGASSDAVAPSTPTLLRASDGGTSYCPEELELGWTRSTDNGAQNEIEYEVRINGRINDVLPFFSKVIVYTEIRGANTVTIVAVDKAGNASAPSNARTVHVDWGAGCESPQG